MKVDTRKVNHSIESYQRKRISFLAVITEASKQGEQAAVYLAEQHVHHLLQMILTANEPINSNRVAAASSLANMAHNCHFVSMNLIANNIPAFLVWTITAASTTDNNCPRPGGGLINYNTNLKPREVIALRKSFMACLRGMSRWEEGARAAVNAGALATAVQLLRNQELDLCEGAAKLVDLIACHAPDLARLTVEAGTVAPLIECFSRSELSIKRAATAALNSISEHDTELAIVIINAGAVSPLLSLLRSLTAQDDRTAQHVLCLLSQLTKADPSVSFNIMHSGVLPAVGQYLSSIDVVTVRLAAVIMKEVAMQGEKGATAVANIPGCVQALVHQATSAKGLSKLPATMALGYISSTSVALAAPIIEVGAIPVFTALLSDHHDAVKCAALWALHQIGQYASHAPAISATGALELISSLEKAEASSNDLKAKCNKALAAIIPLLPAVTTTLPAAVVVAKAEEESTAQQQSANTATQDPDPVSTDPTPSVETQQQDSTEFGTILVADSLPADIAATETQLPQTTTDVAAPALLVNTEIVEQHQAEEEGDGALVFNEAPVPHSPPYKESPADLESVIEGGVGAPPAEKENTSDTVPPALVEAETVQAADPAMIETLILIGEYLNEPFTDTDVQPVQQQPVETEVFTEAPPPPDSIATCPDTATANTDAGNTASDAVVAISQSNAEKATVDNAPPSLIDLL